MNRRLWIVAAPLAASAALAAGLRLAGKDGWKGAPNGCAAEEACYCERWRPGLIRQPANTWSCLAFVAAGLLCALHAYRRGDPAGGRLDSTTLYPALFATGLALIGPASMALHASMTDWGGKVDGASMDFFIAFAAAFGLSRRRGWGDGAFMAALAALTALPMLLKFTEGAPRGELLFGAMVLAVAVIELGPEGATRLPERRWLAVSAALFLLGFSVWLLSVSSDGPLCDPDSLLQGHAVWHVLTAAAAAALYPHFRQERPRAPGLR